MTKYTKYHLILWYQGTGFLIIILLSWLNELFNLPYLLFPGPGHSNWREAIIETVIVMIVWFFSHIFTRHLLARIHDLEEYLKICAWCRKIGDGDNWVSIEEYFSRNLSIKSSHGMCPDCAKKMQEESHANITLSSS